MKLLKRMAVLSLVVLALGGCTKSSISTDAPVSGSEEIDPAKTEADDDGYEESAQKTASRVFLFTSLDQVSEAARACDGLYDGINTLYKRPETSQYYLVIRSDGSDLRSFSRVCNILSEYGTKTRSEYASEAFYAEHYEVITRDRALQVLKNI